MMQKDEMKEALREVMQEELKQFYVDRETHYLHHRFITDWMSWLDACKSTVTKAVVGLLVTAALGLMVIGFYFRVPK